MSAQIITSDGHGHWYELRSPLSVSGEYDGGGADEAAVVGPHSTQPEVRYDGLDQDAAAVADTTCSGPVPM